MVLLCGFLNFYVSLISLPNVGLELMTCMVYRLSQPETPALWIFSSPSLFFLFFFYPLTALNVTSSGRCSLTPWVWDMCFSCVLLCTTALLKPHCNSLFVSPWDSVHTSLA